MMRLLVDAELVISRCLFRNSRISRYQGRIYPLTYYLNLPSPVTSTRTSVRLLYLIFFQKFEKKTATGLEIKSKCHFSIESATKHLKASRAA